MSTAKASGRDAERGMVFILALLTMTLIVVTGVAFLEIAAATSTHPASSLNRAQAQAIAEGGLAVGLQRVDDEPTFTGTIGPTTLGRGSYTVTVTNSGGVIDVVSRSSIGGMSAGVRSQLQTPPPATGLTASTFLTAGDFNLNNNSHLVITGGLKTSSQLSVNETNSTLTGGTVEQNATPWSPVAIDTVAASADAVTTYVDGTVLPGGTYTGTIHCSGRLTFNGSIRIEGTLVIEGNLQIKAFGGDVTLVPPGGGVAAYVTGGQFTLNNVNNLTVRGHLITTSGMNFNRVTNLDGEGTIITNGNCSWTQVVGTWNYQPDIVGSPPPYVSGGPDDGGADGAPEEVTRRPLVAGE